MNKLAIEAWGLVRRFGHKAAVDGVDLKIQAGGIVALVGPNGAGKTTLLHLLLGLLEPTEGQANLLGHSSRDLPAAISPQVQAVGDRHEPPRYVRLSELLNLQAAAFPAFDVQLALQLLVDHGLAPELRFGTLSKGQRRWAMAALALASFPRLLVMDEPADGLDPTARRLLYEHLRQYVNELEATVLVTSHVLGDLERVADEVIILRRGRVALADTLETLREQSRELVLHVGEASPDWLDQFHVFGERSDGAMRQIWLRCRHDEHVIESTSNRSLELADRHPGVSRVNLESLYFALVEGEPPRETAAAAREVVPCS